MPGTTFEGGQTRVTTADGPAHVGRADVLVGPREREAVKNVNQQASSAPSTVFLSINDDILRPALERWLERMPGVVVRVGRPIDATGLEAILLSTTADLSVVEAAVYVAAGRETIVLAALPSRFEGEQYEAAGALYVPMDADGTALRGAFEKLAGSNDLPG